MKTFMIALLVLFASIFNVAAAGELYQVKWHIPIDQRLATLKTFGGMTTDMDKEDAGDVTLLHRYSKMGGDSGFAIIEADSQEHVLSFMLNWATACNIEVTPVVSDEPSRQAIRHAFGLEGAEDSIEEAFNETVDNDGKVYKVEWSIPVENREDILTLFGGMTAVEDNAAKEAAGNVKLIGRWSELGGKSGLALFQAESHQEILKFMLPWATGVDLDIFPVLGDEPTRTAIQGKGWYSS